MVTKIPRLAPFRPQQSPPPRAHQENLSCNQLFQQPASAIADPAIPRFDVTQPSAHINFDAPAVLRKWPSLHRERRTEGAAPYRLVDGTLDECIRVLMAKPASLRHLYEIHTSPQPPLVSPVLSGEYLVELARLCRSLLDRCR
jgi:hypothetical protein